MLKLLRSARQARNHEELFVERYESLLKWALQLTSGDRGLAEDLVHNAFIQFTLTAPDLSDIQNLDGYLYGILRFLHLSQMRRATRSRMQQLSIVDYDSAETGLRVIGPREQVEVQDELRHICQYACARKETSKAGSVLILRFFHGYYPSEIVRVLRVARKVADARLQVARREAKMYLAGSGRLTFLKGTSIPGLLPAGPAATAEGCLTDLRRAVFSSRRGECFSRERLRELYQSDASEGIDRQTSAHIVSCETCLDQVNTLLDLPLISTRFPTDTLGKDRGSKRGPSDGSGGSSSGGGMEPPDRGSAVAGSVQTSKRRAREVFEHRPKELHIAVNGNIQASQKINAEVNEQTLDVNQGDAVSFVEVFSEQDVRLLLFAVDAPPPSGAYEQSRRVQFSDGRSLEATFAFTNPWPTLHVVYFDPLLASEAIEDVLESESLTAASDDQPAKSHSDQKTIEETRSKLSASTTENFLTRSFAEWVGRVRAFNWGFFLKPGSITALLALMLIAVLVFVETRQPVTPLTAATLLEQAAQQEDLLAARTDIAFHRTLQLEERNAAGATLSRRKIEIWQSAEKGITARREYDERGLLVAGDWRRRDGVETIYHHGARPQIQFQNPQSAVRSFADVWEWTPSAKEFSALTAINAQNYVEETDSSYLVTYEPRQTNASGQGLVRATLNLSKPDLRARDATLILRQGEDVREFRFVETSFEQPAAGSVAPAVFEPEPELLSSAKTETSNSRLETANTLSPLPLTPLPVSASADLEIEVLRLLHQAGADLGEQISVMRTTEGLLHIQGVLETTERKNELLRALDSVKTNPAVKIQLSSAAEALQRLPKSSSPGSITVERTDSGTNTLPVDAELRRYFAGKGMSEEQTAANVRRFANNVVERSSQVLQHAWALKRLTERFSPDELRNLTPEARAHWLAMIGEHCRTLEQTNAALRQDLQPIFFPAFPADSGEEGIEIKNDGDLVRATERLLGICTSNHKLLTAAFTVSSDASNAAAIKSPQFLRSLRSAERLSTRIGSAARGSE